MDIQDAILVIERHVKYDVTFDGSHYWISNGEHVIGILSALETISYAESVLKRNEIKGFFSVVFFSTVYFVAVVCIVKMISFI